MGSFQPWVKHIDSFTVVELTPLLIIMFIMCIFLYSTAYQSECKADNACADTLLALQYLLKKKRGDIAKENKAHL